MRIVKLHLPTSLRRCLISALSAALAFTCVGVVEASYQHQDVSMKTYTDFGQNMGRYSMGNTNALLKYLNKDGVKISYLGGQADYTLPHGMIDFDSQISRGEAAGIGYNFVATVKHIADPGGGYPSFTANTLGDNCVRYTAIEINESSSGTFVHSPSYDYKITRLSKLVTDVTCSTVYGSVDGDYSAITEKALAGELLYRSGSGIMYRTTYDGTRTWYSNAYNYITGGIDTIAASSTSAGNSHFSLSTYFTYTGEEVGQSEPLPYKAHEGDSGSPSWIWNERTGQYEYLAALQSGNEYNFSQFRGDCEWTNATMASYDKVVTLGSDHAIYLNAINTAGEVKSDEATGISATLYSGTVTDAEGNILQSYHGVQSGKDTWQDLSALKNISNWYNEVTDYLNASKLASSAPLTYADLFYNDNLVVTAGSATDTQQVVLKDTVDLGVGYVQFKLGEGMETAHFVVASEGTEGNLLNSAGYVVDKGVSVHLQLTNPASHMSEWRKVGEGDLYIEGQGNNDIFLNLGGSGTTYLKRTNNGYAAYNVLANNGTTVVIDDVNQIYRDFTFGNRGGVLDMNGQSMEWNNDNAAYSQGFTIHALDDQAIVANRKADSHTELTWTQSGAQTWLGSFADTEASSLKFIYNGGGTLAMHSIHTNLQHADSGMDVQSGKVTLVGTNTLHGKGSANAWYAATRYFSEDDWHYADASMNVTVKNGATFELGSHARLTGNVAVEEGGTYIMREGVKHQMEYIEGGYVLENTDAIRDFFGHKGDVSLASGSTMQVAFSEGTDSTLVYDGSVSGEGNVSVNAQGGVLRLGGSSTFSGTKELLNGGLHASSNGALGDTSTNKWRIGERAWLASDGFTEASQILSHIDGNSTGVLALSRDVEGQIDLSGHTGLIIGAAEGCDVRYGTGGEALEAVNGQWLLGGGGGNLEVAFKLSGQNDLVLGNAYGKGNVHLSNTDNDFSGNVRYMGGVTLSYDEGALGNAMIDLSYGNRALLVAQDISKVRTNSSGVVLVDRMSEVDVVLSGHTALSLGAATDLTYSGNIVLAEGNPYRFGGGDGCLTVATKLASGYDMVIDSQGYSGGSVVLANAQDFTGHVAIMGGMKEAGEVTLRFVEDNTMVNATGFAVSNGGTIDLAGTNQQFSGMSVSSGGTITDSSADRTSTLTLTSGTLGSGSVVDVAHVVKAGSGTLSLASSSKFSDFSVEAGTLRLDAAASGSFRVGDGAVFNLNRQNVSGTITLANGGSLTNTGTLSAGINVQGNSTLSGSTISLSGALSVAEGAELLVQTGGTTFSEDKNSSLSGAGCIRISTSSQNGYNDVSFDGNNAAFSGTLSVIGIGSGRSVVNFRSVSGFGSGMVHLDNVVFSMSESNTATTAVAATLDVGSKGAVFQGIPGEAHHFTNLSGNGSLRSALHQGGSVWFAGKVNGFTGTLDNDTSNLADDTLRFGFGGAGANYHSLTGSHEAGAVKLFGDAGARLRSSSAGVTYEFNYADHVALNATVEDCANLTQSGAGTLVLTGPNSSTGVLAINAGAVELAEGATWAGSLSGTGTLVNNSTQAVTIASASGFAGSLELMQGSELTLGNAETFSLGAGQQLAVTAGTTVNAQAVLNVSSFVLDGGSLAFSAKAMQADGGALLYLGAASVLNGANGGSQTSISLFDTTELTASEYALLQVSGSLSAIKNNTFSVTGLSECYDASFSIANDKVLVMKLSQKEGYNVWAGTSSQNAWDTGFGNSTPTTTSSVWFTDTAAEKNVTIAGAQVVERLIFNTTEDYVLTTNEGTLEASELELRSSGSVTLGRGITIDGATTLAAGSELIVKDFSNLSGTISGAGTLSIDAGNGEGNLALSGLGTLRVQSGTYKVAGGLTTSTVETIETAGGQLRFTGNALTCASKLVLGGNPDGVALRVDGTGRTNLNGSITLTSDAEVAVMSNWGGNNTATQFNAKLSGNGHSITKTGVGILWLATSSKGGFSAEDVSFVVEEGNLRLGGTSTLGVPTGIQAVTVKDGAILSFCATHSTIETVFTLEGGSTVDLCSTNSGAARYQFTHDMVLSGSGLVSMVASSERTLLLDGALSGDAGLFVTGNGAVELNLNNVNNSFKGGIKADSSSLVINLAGAGSAGTGAVDLSATTQLRVAGNDDGSYGKMVNAISGSGSVEVLSGRLEMSGLNTGSGATTVREGASLRLTNTNSGASSYVVEKGGQLSLSGDGSLTTAAEGVALRARSSASRMRARAAAAEGVLENVTLSDVLMVNTDSTMMGSVSQAEVSIGASEYTISGVEFEDTSVQALSGASSLALTDVVLRGTTSFDGVEGNPWLIDLQNVTLAVEGTPELLDGSLYGLVGSSNVSLYKLTNFTNVALAGNLMLEVPSLPSAVTLSTTAGNSSSYIAFDFGDSVDVSNISVSAVYGGSSTLSHLKVSDSVVVFASPAAAVPEPATSALVLLGLGALALRRRRR